MNHSKRLILITVTLLLFGCNPEFYRITHGDSSGNIPVDTTVVPSSWLTQLGAITKAFPGADHDLYEYCSGTAVDSAGNVYCAGYTNKAIGETNGGSVDAFVMKLNSLGVIQWVRQLGSETQAASPHVISTSGWEACQGVAVDGAGNVYCAGSTTSNLGETLGGSGDAFVIKLNSDGEVQWVRQLGDDTEASSPEVLNTAGNDSCSGVAVDNLGNVYCAGYTGGSLSETFGGINDAFVLKLDSNGNVLWVRQLGDDTETSSAEVVDSSGGESCNSVAVDNSGNVYCAGITTGALGETMGGSSDAFVLKLDSTGAVTWVSQLGNATQVSSADVDDTTQYDLFDGVAVDSLGNVYAGGATRGSLTETNISGGGYDSLIVKFDSVGEIIWASQLGSETQASSDKVNDASGWDACNNVAVDNVGNVYCSGDSGANLAEAAGTWEWDPMALKLNSSGVVQWVRQFGSVTLPHVDYAGGSAYGVAVDANGYVYVAGEIYGYGDEPEGGNENGDVFVAKLRPDGTLDL
jgi:hypothetical protein